MERTPSPDSPAGFPAAPPPLTYELTRELYFRGALRAMREIVGIGAPIALVACFLIFFRALVFGGPLWLLALTGGAVALGMLGGVLFFQGLYNKLEAFDRRSAPLMVMLTLGPAGLAARSDMGPLDLPYAELQRLIVTPAMWLLVASRKGHLTLPATALDATAQAYLRERLKAHGVRGA